MLPSSARRSIVFFVFVLFSCCFFFFFEHNEQFNVSPSFNTIQYSALSVVSIYSALEGLRPSGSFHP